jgi:hypothetical protein
MTEIERYKKALAAVVCRFNVIAGLMDRTSAEREIESILHPKEYEDVELVRYCVIRADGVEKWYGHGANPGIMEGEQIVKLTGTLRREKVRPVERSVTVKVRVNSGGDPFSDPDDQNGCPFHNHPETYGKRGVLTFTWQEDPPKC